MGRKKKDVSAVDTTAEETGVKEPKKRIGGYHRWGNEGPMEARGQISAPASLLKEFRETFPEKSRRQAITVALKWVIAHPKKGFRNA